MKNFVIQGGNRLSGKVKISGSKNAALPIIAASLLTSQKTTLNNVPRIEDVFKMIAILEHLGVEVTFEGNTMNIDPANLVNKEISHEFVCHMRASILLAGSLIGRFNEVQMGFPGGCVLGKRSVDTHLLAFAKLGAKTVDNHTQIHLKADQLTGCEISLSEFSVTGTENIVMAAVLAKGTTKINIAAAEPHVEDLCKFLNQMGADIQGIGTHTLIINGVKSLNGIEYSVTSDYLEAGTFLLAGVLTRGEVEVIDCNPDDLLLFLEKLEEMGVKFEKTKTSIKIIPHNNPYTGISVKTGVHPGFPTDLLAPLTILLSQADGTSHIFETLFEGRFNFLFELEKMGAKIELLNPHQATVAGKKKLKGIPVSSCDIRAGAAIVLAGLVAEGETLVTNINYIDRGYERFDEKLQDLGADIKRVEIG